MRTDTEIRDKLEHLNDMLVLENKRIQKIKDYAIDLQAFLLGAITMKTLEVIAWFDNKPSELDNL
jgi:hypothetical protein